MANAVKNGANLLHTNKSGMSVLHLAVEKGHENFVAFVLRRGTSFYHFMSLFLASIVRRTVFFYYFVVVFSCQFDSGHHCYKI